MQASPVDDPPPFTGSMHTLSWLFALSLILMAIVSAATTCWVLRARHVRSKALPTDWDITARAVFNTDERRIYRQLRDALPDHIVLAKLPLLRFSQAEDPQRMKYWYRVLGQLNVTFAICGVNGRLLAALDLDNGRTPSRRTVKIKQSVLAACRVRYLRLPVDHLPSIAELQLLVPRIGDAALSPKSRVPQGAGSGRVPARTVPTSRNSVASEPSAASAFGPSSFSPSTFRYSPQRDSAFSASTFGSSTPAPASFDDPSFADSSFGDPVFGDASSRSMTSRPTAAPLQPEHPRAVTPRATATGIHVRRSLPVVAPRPAVPPRPTRTPLWQESSFFQDSFFGSDDRPDVSVPSDFGGFDSDLLPPPPMPFARRAGPLGRTSNSHDPSAQPMGASRADGASRRPMRGRPRPHGELGISDTDIVGVVVDTHDAHRPAARRLLGHRDLDRE